MAKAELEVKPGDSRDLLNEIRGLIEDARRQTLAAVNVGLTALYWQIGNRILREVLGNNTVYAFDPARLLWRSEFVSTTERRIRKQRPYARINFLVLGEQFTEITHLVQSLLVVLHTCLHQQSRDTVLHLHHLPHQQMPVPQGTPSIPYLCVHHVALREEVASQTVADLAGIDLIVLLLGGCNRSQHQRVSHLDLGSVRKQMIVDPAGEDRCLHRHG